MHLVLQWRGWPALLAAVLTGMLLVACGPWYVRYGIKSEQELRQASAVPRLEQAMEGSYLHDYPEIIEALEQHGEAGLKGLATGMQKRLFTRKRTVEAVGRVKSKKGLPIIILGLRDEDLLVREAALEALEAIEPSPEKRFQVLTRVISIERDKEVRATAQSALNDLKYRVNTRALKKTPAPAKAAAAPAAAPRPARAAIVAVFDIEDSSKKWDAALLDQLTDYLASKVAQSSRFKVVPRSQIRARLTREKTKAYKSCYDEACQIELGKALSAQKTISTKIIKVGSRCALIANLYDLRTETAERASSVETNCSTDLLMTAAARLAQQLAAQK